MPDNIASPPPSAPNGWTQWSKYVLEELKRLNKCYDSLDARLQIMQKDVITLKVKAGFWGAGAGALVGIVVSFIAAIVVKSLGE